MFGGRAIGEENHAAGRNKIASIQLLRAIAASIVAFWHIAFAFADHVGPGLGLGRIARDGLASQTAVMLFFIVSGYVMVIAARGSFGQRGAARTFWLRRFNRIMPPYWLATGALAFVFLTVQPQPVPPVALIKSLALVPFWPDSGDLRPLPFLWVGWTLFYEVAFYAVFGLFIGLGRVGGIAATSAVLLVLVLAGLAIPAENAFLFALTRPVLVMFLIGMGLAWWRETGGRASSFARIAAVFALVPALVLIGPPDDLGAMGFDYLAWCGLPAGLLAFAILGGPLTVPAPRAVIAAGDMSYALYLLHVPIAWFWLWLWGRLWGRLAFFDPGPWDFFASALIAAVVGSWLFHAKVERPMTAALNRWVGSPHEAQSSA